MRDALRFGMPSRRTDRVLSFAVLATAGLVTFARAGESVEAPPVTFTVSAPPTTPDSDGVEQTTARLIATIEPGWHLYSATQPPGGPLPTRFVVEDPFVMHGAARVRAPHVAVDDAFGAPTEYYVDSVTFTLPLALERRPLWGDATLRVRIRYQVCDGHVCLAPHEGVATSAVSVGR